MKCAPGNSLTKCGSKSCAECVQSVDHLFRDLPEVALNELNAAKSTHHFRKGQTLFYAGNPPQGIYCVSAGTIKIENTSAEGKTHLLRVVKEGGLLGYRSLLAQENYRANAVASDEVEVCLIPKTAFLKLIQTYPELMLKVVFRLATELREAETRMQSLVEKETPARVAEAVLYFKTNFPDQNWTRKELAEWAGTSPETVMRVLSQFEKEKILELSGRVIQILNRARLYEVAELENE